MTWFTEFCSRNARITRGATRTRSSTQVARRHVQYNITASSERRRLVQGRLVRGHIAGWPRRRRRGRPSGGGGARYKAFCAWPRSSSQLPQHLPRYVFSAAGAATSSKRDARAGSTSFLPSARSGWLGAPGSCADIRRHVDFEVLLRRRVQAVHLGIMVAACPASRGGLVLARRAGPRAPRVRTSSRL